jgi:hypothetical protein
MANFEEIATGKVATFISETELAFNVGSKAGVKADDVVTLFERVEIKDPDSKKVLGAVRVPRLTLKVNIVREEFGTCVVTDREPMNSFADAARIRGLKKIVQRNLLSDDVPANSVEVSVGDEVVIRRREMAETSEPPF